CGHGTDRIPGSYRAPCPPFANRRRPSRAAALLVSAGGSVSRNLRRDRARGARTGGPSCRDYHGFAGRSVFHLAVAQPLEGSVAVSLTLIGGGARSGKSRHAMVLARQCGSRLAFIATARAEDDEMRERIVLPRSDRGSDFT